ncbi:maleylpyruvate isomerase family mycothiol-dependent enzyme [Sporichthya sp.]|uniref:maleylpyruvate isomerase family mycothiol-dependent enzyme n=1 Tax=Sporichthya sp. TaxID=65475 RepID=UPI001832A568|nr:maleylpyruvate isomerase family mycothiol-dependent enzyme [Sporichthya sp.]MBA3744736.1 maleylpyruvate isomerase family mycothiol-dependent enzyme [Sporichthya sp.]
MHLAEVYHASRTRLMEQAANLTEAQQSAQVPATPLWTVADVYRHLTGVASDVLTGRLEGRGTPEWTAVQVASRAELGLAEVCAEWDQIAPKLEQLIHDSGFEMARACFDVWAHEQDVADALGGEGDRSDPAIPTLVASLLAMLRGNWAAHPDLPTVELVVDGDSHRYGEGEPELTLRSSGYEFVRMIISRRSKEQMLAADWTGASPSRIFDALCVFPLPEDHLADVPGDARGWARD